MSPFLLSVGKRLVSELSKTHRSVVPTLRKLREEWGTPIHSHYVGVRHSQRRVMIAAAGGAAQLNRFHAAMKLIKRSRPETITVGGGLMYTAVPQKIMAHLKESLKTGKPLSRMDTGAELKVWEKLVLGIIVIAEPAAKALCDILKIGIDKKGLKVLDIAGGSSIFGMTILTRDSTAEVTQLDWPNVNAVAKKANQARGLEGKIRFIDGEHHTAPIETNHYDLVLASNFCRFESPQGNQKLFAKAHSALKAGGILVVNDFVPNEERTEPTFALRFSVYTLTHTPQGECWTLSQYSDWLEKAGFRSIETYGDTPNTLPGTTLILAKKT